MRESSRFTRPLLLIAVLAAFIVGVLPAQEVSRPRIDPAGIDGAILLCGSYDVSDAMLDEFVALAGGAGAKIVFLNVDKAPFGGLPSERVAAAARKRKAVEPTVAEYQDAAAALKDATGVWLNVDSVSSWGKALKARLITEECRALLKRGGVVGSAAAGVRYVGSKELSINGAPCLKLLPDALVEPGSKQESPRLKKSTASWRGLVGYELEHNAAMLVKGRSISVIGDGNVHIFLPKGNNLPLREIILPAKTKEDLTALRRALLARMQEPFPPAKLAPPIVEKGTLAIVGGGGSPVGFYNRFIELAGGRDNAKIVIFPTANPDPLPKSDGLASVFRKAGAKKVTVLEGRTLKDVESPAFLDALREATGIWFGGGRQWRFVDAYEDTKALPLMFDVLRRGGIIGGTSAGASIQAEYMCRGSPLGNLEIRYEGYERGLGFLPGVAVDQHFTQRKRHKDMTSLMKTYPQLLGIGIDEATAIIVQGHVAEVIGKGKVHFYDTNRKVAKDEADHIALTAGSRYDLKDRKVLAGDK